MGLQNRAAGYVANSKSVHRGQEVGPTPVQKRMSVEANSPGQAKGVVKQVFKGPTYNKR